MDVNKFDEQSLRYSFLFSPLPALWNVYPVKCAAYFSGAEPIPPGSGENKKRSTLGVLCASAVSND